MINKFATKTVFHKHFPRAHTQHTVFTPTVNSVFRLKVTLPLFSSEQNTCNFSTSIYKGKRYNYSTLNTKQTMSGCKCAEKKDKPEAPDKIMGPLESALYEKIITTLNPQTLIIRNDSWKHAHHTGMKGVENVAESHFHVTIVSEKFSEPGLKSSLARHRYIFKVLDDEIKGGIHGFQVVCKTPQEWSKQQGQAQSDKPARAPSGQYFS